MRQIVSDLHTPIIVCARCPFEGAVARAELMRWYLKGILKFNLAYDERRHIILRLVMNHADEFGACGCAVTVPAVEIKLGNVLVKYLFASFLIKVVRLS